MKKSAAVILGFIATAALAQDAQHPSLPVFPTGTVTDAIQGVTIADPYRALENGDDPAVTKWSDAENAVTRAALDAVPGRDAVAAEITRLIKATSPSFSSLQARGTRIFALYRDPAKQQPSLVMLNAAADPASRQALVDPNALDSAGHIAIDWYVASPDGSKVGVSLSMNGSEDGTLHIFDTKTGKEIETPIDRVQYPTAGGAMAWTADGKGFWYTRYPGAEMPDSERHFNLALYLHRLGEPVDKDRLVLSAKNGIPRTGEIFLDENHGGAKALASVQLGDGGQWQHYVLSPDGKAQQISKYEDHVIGGAIIGKDGTVYAVSRLNAPMGKVVALAPPYKGGMTKAAILVPEQQDAAIIDGGEWASPLILAGPHLFINRIAGGPSEISDLDLSSHRVSKVETPALSAVNEIDALPDGDALYRVDSYLEPAFFMHWTAKSGQSVRTGLAETSPISYADAEVVRIFATSKDGTKVPVNVIRKKGTVLDGHNPVLLYGYGGYGVNITPHFGDAFMRLWLDAGGVYAVANIRGGGEFGDRWHREGNLTKKQNVFDDFAAAGEELIKLGYTSHDRLALLGGSNGGLLMGAMITQHPDLAHAVISAVGIYDMLRVELDPNGAFNVTEFGTVKDPAQFKALYAYSPYHHVVKGTNYPAVLLLTGANDGRVNPFHSRKFAAALQAATASGKPIYLRTSKSSGHGIGSSLDERIAERTDMLMFLFSQLQMSPKLAAK